MPRPLRHFSFTRPLAARPSPDPLPAVDESELIDRVLAGEREAFHDLVRRHSGPLLVTLRAHMGNAEDVREILQETWLRAWEHLGDLRQPGRLRSWLLSVALNRARALQRRGLQRGAEPLAGDEPAPEESVGLGLERSESLERLRWQVAALPPRMREVVDMRLNHELSHAEIARRLEISEEASRASFYQALRRLRAGLEGNDPEGRS